MKDFHNAVQYRVGIEASIIYLVLFSFLFFVYRCTLSRQRPRERHGNIRQKKRMFFKTRLKQIIAYAELLKWRPLSSLLSDRDGGLWVGPTLASSKQHERILVGCWVMMSSWRRRQRCVENFSVWVTAAGPPTPGSRSGPQWEKRPLRPCWGDGPLGTGSFDCSRLL